MKWKTLLQIIAIIIFLTFAINHLLLIHGNRYEFFPSVNDYGEVKLENGEVRFIPVVYSAVFDKVTGKIYAERKYLKPTAIQVNDYINRKFEVYPLDVKAHGNFAPEWNTLDALLKEQEKEKTLQLYRAIK